MSPSRILSFLRPLAGRFPRLVAFYRTCREQIEYMKPSVLTPWGFSLAGSREMASGDFEPRETQAIRTVLGEVDVLVNIGANIGYYCCHACAMDKQVIAFEPIPRNARFLCRNMDENGWSGVEIFPLALSNKPGVLRIYGGTTGASIVKGWAEIPESYVTLVPASTLDMALGERLHGKRVLVLVDIEGAEKWMLEGAARMLMAEPKPVWILEICFTENLQGRINPEFRQIFETFWGHGYRAYSVDADMREVTVRDVERWVAQGSRDFGYVTYLFR